MSNTKSYAKKSQEANKCCNFCLNAGQPESVYRSHFLRASPEPGSKVVCPLLLATECNYCYQPGHTPKSCPVLKAQEKTNKRREFNAKKADQESIGRNAKPMPKVKTNHGIFASLYESDDEQEQVQKQEQVNETFSKEMFPALPNASFAALPSASRAAKVTTAPQCVSALKQICPGLTVAAKMPEVFIPRPQVGKLVHKTLTEEKDEFIKEYIESMSEDIDLDNDIYEEAVDAFNKKKYPASTINWAQSDSEDEDDEDW
jgi:hypothetical protein